MTCEEAGGGYRVGVRFLQEVWVYVNLGKGLALWAGTKDEVEARYSSVRNRCKRHGIEKQFDREIRMLCLPGDVDVIEMSYMLSNNRVPRRVSMRMV